MDPEMHTQNRESVLADVEDERPRVLVVGLGNPILGDDGVGWRVAEAVQQRLAEEHPAAAVAVELSSRGGLGLMEQMVGYDRAIIVDALATGQPAGSVSVFPLEALPEAAGTHLTSAHDASLQTALRLGRQLGARLPRSVLIVGVEAECVYEFSAELTPAVSAAVPRAVHAVLQHLAKIRRLR